MSKSYTHVGAQPITVKGKEYVKGDEILAEPEDMAFFLAILAVEETKKGSPKGATPVKAVTEKAKE